ncbi:MAG: DUF1415 domain-containing protein [Cyanobacteria bacterium P01_E01_bin.6]
MNNPLSNNHQRITTAVQRWLDQVVVGLDLCPFAAAPNRKGQIKIQVSTANTEVEFLSDLLAELRLLDQTPFEELETTLLVTPSLLTDFDEYNNFLVHVDELLRQFGWEGEYQVASFHPQYQFSGTQATDAENLTNRSPYPMLHILREASVSRALESFDHPEIIPETNIQTVRRLSREQRQHLFPYLFSQ